MGGQFGVQIRFCYRDWANIGSDFFEAKDGKFLDEAIDVDQEYLSVGICFGNLV